MAIIKKMVIAFSLISLANLIIIPASYSLSRDLIKKSEFVQKSMMAKYGKVCGLLVHYWDIAQHMELYSYDAAQLEIGLQKLTQLIKKSAGFKTLQHYSATARLDLAVIKNLLKQVPENNKIGALSADSYVVKALTTYGNQLTFLINLLHEHQSYNDLTQLHEEFCAKYRKELALINSKDHRTLLILMRKAGDDYLFELELAIEQLSHSLHSIKYNYPQLVDEISHTLQGLKQLQLIGEKI